MRVGVRRTAKRRGTTAVETGVVLGVCLLIFFAIFEYGRFFFTKHLLENAAREGARYAVAHTHNKSESEIKDQVLRYLVGQDAKFEGFDRDSDVEVYAIVLREQTGGPVAGTRLATWDAAKPTDGVIVKVKGTYKPLFFTQLNMDSSIEMEAQSVMYSEGN